jgi:hypothetical protein
MLCRHSLNQPYNYPPVTTESNRPQQVLGLMDENTAAALLFSVDNVYEEPTNIIFYNLGATSLQVRTSIGSRCTCALRRPPTPDPTPT